MLKLLLKVKLKLLTFLPTLLIKLIILTFYLPLLRLVDLLSSIMVMNLHD